MHYYSFNVADYMLSTAHLTPMEDITYRRLLDLYYTTEKPIPLDTDWVSRRIRVDSEYVVYVLGEFFDMHDDGYYNDRASEEITKYQAICDRNKANGKAGGRPKKTESVPTGNRDATDSKANQEPITNNQEPVKTKAQREKRADVFDSHSKLIELGVGDAVAKDFMAIRKKKRAPLTETALAEIQRESVKAGITLHQALEKCCARGWQGFEADWVTTTTTNARASPYESEKDRSRREFAEAIFGKKNDEPANERDITSVAERLD